MRSTAVAPVAAGDESGLDPSRTMRGTSGPDAGTDRRVTRESGPCRWSVPRTAMRLCALWPLPVVPRPACSRPSCLALQRGKLQYQEQHTDNPMLALALPFLVATAPSHRGRPVARRRGDDGGQRGHLAPSGSPSSAAVPDSGGLEFARLTTGSTCGSSPCGGSASRGRFNSIWSTLEIAESLSGERSLALAGAGRSRT